MRDATRTLMEFIPKKEQGRFKALLAGQDSLTVHDKRNEPWVFIHGWDILRFDMDMRNRYHYCVECLQYRSDKMYEYGDVIIFIENKGPSGQMNSTITIITTELGKLLP